MANMAPPPTQSATLGFASAPANAFKLATPDRYISLGAFINEVNKPDNRTQLVKTFGNQGITGFLQLVGAVKTAGTADEVTWWEEQRLHPTVNFTTSGAVASSGKVMTVNITSLSSTSPVRVNDIVLWDRQQRAIVTAVSTTGITLANLANAELVAATTGTSYALPIIGNLYGQGTDQPTQFLESNVVKRTNPYMIMKEIFKVTGSQATNIGWVDVGGGDYRWFIKGESDTRQRFVDKREMMMLLGQKNENSSAAGSFTSGIISGSEGYFSAIENRGLVTDGYINTLVDLDSIITALDRNGAGPEYALYVDRLQDLAIDDLVAKGVAGASLTAGVATQFGAFNNSPNMAIELGFKSLGRGGYTFHKHDWKLLNDPTLLGVPATALSGTTNTGNGFAGVMIPMATVVDPKTGNREFPLEINYKSTNGVSREMQHWLTGSFMGATNSTRDELQFNYLSEIALVTRAANRHVLIKRD
jgi:hypothetical protein